MHLLSARHRSEFLSIPELVRFTMAEGSDGREATLLIKASTLVLKYFWRLKRFRLLFVRMGPWLAYGVQVNDDPDHPITIWSFLEQEDEADTLRALAREPKCVVFLFNELAISTAWAEVDIDTSAQALRCLIDSAALHPEDETESLVGVGPAFDALVLGKPGAGNGYILELPDVSQWHPVQANYITRGLSTSQLSIFEADEGDQQEEIALWLTDQLRLSGVVRRPQIHEPNKVRELTDLLLPYEHGLVLIESKALAILERNPLPGREKLTRDLVKHLKKAVNQLVGATKNFRRGYRITDLKGSDITLGRDLPPHVIVLVPDLSLLGQETAFGGEFLVEVSEKLGGFLHFLDLNELLRVVQAAQMIFERGEMASLMTALDYYLLRRAQRAALHPTPHLEVLFRADD